jgi:hypothetical protein
VRGVRGVVATETGVEGVVRGVRDVRAVYGDVLLSFPGPEIRGLLVTRNSRTINPTKDKVKRNIYLTLCI